MRDEQFADLLASAKEAKEILAKKIKPSRSFVFEEPNAKEIRSKLNMTQEDFASLLNISVNTLRNWEQSRRKPEGPARVLLSVAAQYPEVFLNSRY